MNISKTAVALVAAAAGLLMSGRAFGQEPPAGWLTKNMGSGLVLASPGDPASRVIVTVVPPARPQGDLKTWFGNQALAMAQQMGKTLGTTAVVEQSGILLRVVQLENAAQVKLRAVFYGYPTANGMSFSVVLIPPGVSDQDERLNTADQFVQGLAAKRFEIAAPAAEGPPASSGISPSRPGDADLTYHAKALIPKDRDVPIQSSYVFVGYAFGATYGGVGTSMNWGQHAVQQILLLFANGVAAKTDLRGGNLAGKYQAEGFATLDVGNPAVVSGAPFGHWTEDAETVHIRWNIGKPSDLKKNGTSLETTGERWTPYKVAEGVALEGTFVRKMEAPLHSQAIQLKKDGSFVGDGVNVTMGGSIVSPNFPERGSGLYAIHKGSMILQFSNGFTQAIACIIDFDANGNAKTILLNGFPFERVR